jgi:hypothetical protein
MRRIVSPGLRVVVLLSLAGLAAPAFAYLDPSTGSMILSAIVGVFATAGLALKTYWYKFKALFRRSPPPGRGTGRDPGRDIETSQGGSH